MKDSLYIGYVGRHYNSNSNDDEGAIARSLVELGHGVRIIQEDKFKVGFTKGCDLILFHHTRNLQALKECDAPKAFWCFDRIWWDSPEMQPRNLRRRAWVEIATNISEVGFCTDGDWVEQDKSGKLVWLTQGFNQYLPQVPYDYTKKRDTILFVGGGKDYGRDVFVSEMKQKYGDKFIHVEKGYYGQQLAELIDSAAIVVAPPNPVTSRYWSNRVYLTMGLGGFLLHPYTQGLVDSVSSENLEMYCSMGELHMMIKQSIYHLDEIEQLRIGGQKQILNEYTYKQRCEQLIQVIKDKGIV